MCNGYTNILNNIIATLQLARTTCTAIFLKYLSNNNLYIQSIPLPFQYYNRFCYRHCVPQPMLSHCGPECIPAISLAHSLPLRLCLLNLEQLHVYVRSDRRGRLSNISPEDDDECINISYSSSPSLSRHRTAGQPFGRLSFTRSSIIVLLILLFAG